MRITEGERISRLKICVKTNLSSELANANQKLHGLLLPEEQALIRAYSGMVAYTINEFKRGNIPKEISCKVCCLWNNDNFSKALDKLPNLYPTIPLYRGTKVPILLLKSMIQNSIYTDKAFISTSMDWITTDKTGGAVWHLTADIQDYPPSDYAAVRLNILKHKSGKDISSFSADANTDGREVIFMPNTKFKIVNTPKITQEDIKRRGLRDVYEIDLEEM